MPRIYQNFEKEGPGDYEASRQHSSVLSKSMFEEELATEVISIFGKLDAFKEELCKKWRWVQSLGPRSQVKQDILGQGHGSQVVQRAITL